jgi:hypothetical protein
VGGAASSAHWLTADQNVWKGQGHERSVGKNQHFPKGWQSRAERWVILGKVATKASKNHAPKDFAVKLAIALRR